MTTGTTSTTDTGGPDAEVNVFAVELERWRDVRGFSRAALAKAMGYDRSYVSKVLSGAERPSEAFARNAEAALRAGGARRTAFRDFEAHRPAKTRPAAAPVADPQAGTGSLVVDHDDATLRYNDGVYRLTQRRHLVNQGAEPISRYLIRISVDRYPGDPERSNRLYSEDPLTWDEIDRPPRPKIPFIRRARPHPHPHPAQLHSQAPRRPTPRPPGIGRARPSSTVPSGPGRCTRRIRTTPRCSRPPATN